MSYVESCLHASIDSIFSLIPSSYSFFFSQLDPNDPTRQFSFVLQVDDEDKYEIANCQPSIDAAILVEICNRLNDTDDMSYLVRRMRKLRPLMIIVLYPYLADVSQFVIYLFCRPSIFRNSVKIVGAVTVHNRDDLLHV